MEDTILPHAPRRRPLRTFFSSTTDPRMPLEWRLRISETRCMVVACSSSRGHHVWVVATRGSGPRCARGSTTSPRPENETALKIPAQQAFRNVARDHDRHQRHCASSAAATFRLSPSIWRTAVGCVRMGIVKWTVFREAKLFPFEGAYLVETFDFVGLCAFRFPVNQPLAHCLDSKWKEHCLTENSTLTNTSCDHRLRGGAEACHRHAVAARQ